MSTAPAPIDQAAPDAAERAEADTRLVLALEAAGLGVWQTEIGSGRLDLDANLAAMFGLPAAPVTVSDAAWMSTIHPDDRARFLAELNARRFDKRPLSVEFRLLLPDGTIRWLAVHGNVVRRPDGTPYGSVGIARDVTERSAAAERQRLLLNELNHRVRNTLAAVLSLAQQTAAGAGSVADFLGAFQSRVMALAEAHNLLTRKNWEGVALGDIAAAVLAPDRKARSGRIALNGPDCALTAGQALALTLGLHELATNARKYGALSTPEGKIAVTWAKDSGAGAPRIVLEWHERDGPAVTPPTRKGFGSRLLTAALAGELDGTVALDFAPSGLRCTIAFATKRGAP